MNTDDGKPKRSKILEAISRCFQGTMDKKAVSPFVVNQVMMNFEEMVNLLPDEELEKIPMAYGSRNAAPWVQQKRRENMKETMTHVYKATIGMDEEDLNMLGLYTDEKNTVRVILNKRKFDLRDVEHLLCKLSIVMQRVTGGRPSVHPKMSRPHLHPVKVDGFPDDLMGHLVVFIAQEALECFIKQENLKIPQCFEPNI